MSSTAGSTNKSSAVVVDASAIFDLITNGARAPQLRSRLLREDVILYAPAVLDLEILQTARKYVLRGEMDANDAAAAFASYATLVIARFAIDPLFGRIWSLRDNFTAYDAAYVALAEAYRIPLITLDARLAKAASLTTANVELFA
ncbi:MAG: VapC toxin family PIN domain ribonuclease [Acidobacteria bacterium]|nr:MAG: VapC toxin family PIN domain ribonuclease [Acidobacteriota bacterium]